MKKQKDRERRRWRALYYFFMLHASMAEIRRKIRVVLQGQQEEEKKIAKPNSC